jgi:hypothetical protein
VLNEFDRLLPDTQLAVPAFHVSPFTFHVSAALDLFVIRIDDVVRLGPGGILRFRLRG